MGEKLGIFEPAYAIWIRGHSAEIENPDDVRVEYRGSEVRVEARLATINWLHFAVPTPVMVDEWRLRPGKVKVRYKAGGSACISAVHVYDGENKLLDKKRVDNVVDGGWTEIVMEFDFVDKTTLAVYWGLGLSIELTFGAAGDRLEFDGVGCEFQQTTRVCSQRFPIRTNKGAMLEFPYCSNWPIEIPNPDIKRILICLHGTGAIAETYLHNGIEAARVVNALDETLIIAPQFIHPLWYYRTSEYYRMHLGSRDFPAELLHWNCDRYWGEESVERDIDGDGRPDSGTVSSFAVLDTMLERLIKPSLFKNLQIIVLVGQSNGGWCINRYSVFSQFELLAAKRGIKVRYVAMGTGAYLYLDSKRAVPGTTDRFETPTRWPDEYDCPDETFPSYDDWPFGLADREKDSCPGYVRDIIKDIGLDTILTQFAGRDVVYLQGADDTSGPPRDCKVRLQGRHTLERGLIYINYLHDFFPAGLCHQRFAVDDVEHNGPELMQSDKGLEVIFSLPSPP